MLVLGLVLITGAEEIPTEACLACHGTEGFTGPGDRALYVNGDAFTASTHGVFPCVTCHGDAAAIPHEEKLKPVGLEACAGCHSDEVTAYQQSIHGQARAQGVHEAASCADCHGDIHAVTLHTEPTSAAHWTKLAATCARCHGNLEMAEKFRIPVVRPVEAYLQSAHARAIQDGKRAAVCSDCHGSHDILPGSDPRASIWRANVPQTCGKCHADVLATYRDSVHGEAFARGARLAPVCTDCHGEHRILGPSEPSSPVFSANIPGDTCGRCHADARLSEKYGLPSQAVTAFQDSYHGLALRAGKLTVANCSSCHGVHDIRPSSDPRSHVNPANLPATCGKCHPGAGGRFALGSVHSLAPTNGTRAVAAVRFVYLWIIGLTIGGMVVHNLLDLGRKARRSQPLHPPLVANAPERMSRLLRWQHGLVMLSFPVLVYTGFALKYPESWWASPLLQWETQLGLRGLLHRTAAVVLVVALLWHVVHLALSARLRACMRAMVPSIRDVHGVRGALAYYLGWRGAPPHGGAFSYIEKAEYWAFMWGTALMTVTGFLLWFENATLSYLPKWVTDVATALHFYEAVLATLAILVWHLYWVIFDPDVYPMDWSWWDGHAPASRVHERRAGGGSDADGGS